MENKVNLIMLLYNHLQLTFCISSGYSRWDLQKCISPRVHFTNKVIKSVENSASLSGKSRQHRGHIVRFLRKIPFLIAIFAYSLVKLSGDSRRHNYIFSSLNDFFVTIIPVNRNYIQFSSGNSRYICIYKTH